MRAKEVHMAEKRWLTEDKLALIMGLFLFALGMLNFAGIDALGWSVKTSVWTSADKIFSAATGGYKGVPGYAALIFTYIFITAFLSVGVKFLGGSVPRLSSPSPSSSSSAWPAGPPGTSPR
jgi:hypothetical protein